MTVYNNLLFSEIFFRQIRSETADLDNLRAILSTIRDTWQYYLSPPPDWDGPGWSPSNPFSPDDVAQLRSNIVEQILAYLELTYGPCQGNKRAFFLYSDWAKEDRTGLCLVLPYSAHIEGRDPEMGIIPKGRNYAQQLIRLLRQHGLDWGVLTNGRHWQLLHGNELSPTETYLHVDLERIIATDDIENYDDYAIWTRLQALSALIDQGDLAAGMPAYNGGLFDPGRRPFLTWHRIRNDYLQAALIRFWRNSGA
jgi:hypothetical protein